MMKVNQTTIMYAMDSKRERERERSQYTQDGIIAEDFFVHEIYE